MNNRINNKANETATSQLLIELIKGMELIYNNNHPDYKNAAKRGKVWKSITNVMNESFRCGWGKCGLISVILFIVFSIRVLC